MTTSTTCSRTDQGHCHTPFPCPPNLIQKQGPINCIVIYIITSSSVFLKTTWFLCAVLILLIIVLLFGELLS